MKNLNVEPIFNQFHCEGNFVSAEPTGNGHINDTFLATSDTPKQYIIQRINHNIFKDPVALMENIESVCTHLRTKALATGGDADREVLSLIPTKTGKSYVRDAEGYYWRTYVFITDAISYDIVPDNDLFYHAAYKFGEFQKLLLDFDASRLHETIPYFHHTKNRLEKFKEALQNNIANRAHLVQEEIDFVLSHEKDAALLLRSEERRVGKDCTTLCRTLWSPGHST